MRVSLQRRAIQNVKMHVSLQRRAQKCMKQAHGVGSRPRHRKIIVLPQFQTSDQHEVTKGLHRRRKNLHFTTVLDVRRARSDERVARAHREFAFHHSFGRPTITFCVKALRVASASSRICISPQFWARPTLRKRKEEILKRSSIFEEQRSQQLFSADFLSSLSQQLLQPFSAAFLSSLSQQPFSAALLSSFSQQPFSAALLSSSSQQIFSAALLSYHLAVVRGWWSASNIIFSSSLGSSSQQLFSVWSGVGGQLVTSSSAALLSSSSQLSSCCGQGLVVKYATVL